MSYGDFVMKYSFWFSLTATVFTLPVLFAADTAPAVLPPLSIRDTLGIREIREIQMAPSGRTVAYVRRQANLEQKHNDDSLVLLSVADAKERVVFTDENLEGLLWDRSEQFIYALIRQSKLTRLVRVNLATTQVTVCYETSDPLDAFTLSPDGKLCVVAVGRYAAGDQQQRRSDTGLVYDLGKSRFTDILEGNYRELSHECFIGVNTVDLSEREIGRIPFTAVPGTWMVAKLRIDGGNRRMLVEVRRAGSPTKGGPPFNYDLGILEMATGAWTEVMPGSVQTEMGGVWLGDTGQVFFTSEKKARIYSHSDHSVIDLPWVKESFEWVSDATYEVITNSVFVQTRTSLVRVSLRDQAVEKIPGAFSSPSFSAGHSRYAFLSESSDQPPEVAVVDTPGAALRRLTKTNPILDERSLGRVEKISITNGYGTQSDAYLVLPVGYDQNRRYPLILASYGFRGRFLTTAEWHTTFPVQTLAGEGYAVLLVNTPPLVSAQRLAGDPVKARENEGWQVLSTFETAVQQMVNRGVADPAKLGLYGWSHGAFVVEFILAHSKLPFAAACVGEGGDYNPSAYWLWGSRSWPEIYHNTFGGPFTAKTAAAYLEFSPVLSVDRVRTPLFLEFMNTHIALGFEFLVPLRMLSIPAEMVTYEREEHNFVRPTVRFASMHRKVDWFNYWMLGKKNPNPADAEQYVRWEQMNEEWISSTRREAAASVATSRP